MVEKWRNDNIWLKNAKNIKNNEKIAFFNIFFFHSAHSGCFFFFFFFFSPLSI
jgi:hypothetical protein